MNPASQTGREASEGKEAGGASSLHCHLSLGWGHLALTFSEFTAPGGPWRLWAALDWLLPLPMVRGEEILGRIGVRSSPPSVRPPRKGPRLPLSERLEHFPLRNKANTSRRVEARRQCGWPLLQPPHPFLRGQSVGAGRGPESRPPVGPSVSVPGAGAGSVVLGDDEAVSASDPGPHRRVAQQNPEDQQVLRGQAGGVGSRAEPSWGGDAVPRFDSPHTPPSTRWVASSSPHLMGPCCPSFAQKVKPRSLQCLPASGGCELQRSGCDSGGVLPPGLSPGPLSLPRLTGSPLFCSRS